jgi:hypothetical protein
MMPKLLIMRHSILRLRQESYMNKVEEIHLILGIEFTSGESLVSLSFKTETSDHQFYSLNSISAHGFNLHYNFPILYIGL